MPIRRRVGRPGLLGVAARTAVVTGTASAVQNAGAKRRAAQQQAATPAAPQAAAPAAETPAATPKDLVAELSTLATLHQSGALTDEEFAAAKAQLLG